MTPTPLIYMVNGFTVTIALSAPQRVSWMVTSTSTNPLGLYVARGECATVEAAELAASAVAAAALCVRDAMKP